MKKTLFITVFSLLSSAAFADQCAVVNAEMTRKALSILKDAQTVHSFCQPCGDRAPQKLYVRNASFKQFDNSNYEVLINGKSIDLAYTYVNGLNLATIVGCKTTGVSPAIDLLR